jgi:hypothetical protein
MKYSDITNPELRDAVRQAKGSRTTTATSDKPGRATWRDRAFTAADLQTMTFPPLKFILPGLVPEGATLLVSRPKLGKSWLVLDLAIAAASDRFTLGELKPAQGDVLYLALEDGRRRLQRRLTKLLPTFGASWPQSLTIVTEWRRADQGGLDDIKEWIAGGKAPRLVIVDTLAQFRKMADGKTQIYADDYAAISGLQRLASEHNISVIIVHHDRKAEADDVFDTVSGSLGLTGAADTIVVMKRQAGTVSLHVRGRDVEEAEKALEFSKSSCRWRIIGEAADFRRSDERGRVLTAMRDSGQPMSASEVAIAAELKSRNAADQLLFKMFRDNEIIRVDRGRYALSETQKSDSSVSGNIEGADKIDKKVRSEFNSLNQNKKLLTDNLTELTNASKIDSLHTDIPSSIIPADDFPDMPPFLRRQVPPDRRPALGPSGDSLDDFK